MKIYESMIQALLMDWTINEKHHACAIPNRLSFFGWECDLLTMTRADLFHEFEIKLSKSDYKKDFDKSKHRWFDGKTYNYKPPFATHPSYFWFVTYGLRIEPPEYAGWIGILGDPEKPQYLKIDVRKEAPRLHTLKPKKRQKEALIRILSSRLTREYCYRYLGKRLSFG